jgi:hypothetical protein
VTDLSKGYCAIYKLGGFPSYISFTCMCNTLNRSSNVATEFDKILHIIYNIIFMYDRYLRSNADV